MTESSLIRHPHLPIAVIGAGPVGLAAAAHLLDRGLQPLVLEAADRVGAAIRDWGHVRVFSPWEMNVDPVAARLLAARGWVHPARDEHPTGTQIVERYLEPLAAVPEIAGALELGTRVVAVTRAGVDKLKDAGRDEAPFELLVESGGTRRRVPAAAVIDASGTWQRPNPLGAGGLPAEGEEDAAARIAYRIPDVLGADRERYAGRRVLVAGSGHSAFNVLLDLVALREDVPGTQVTWAIRRSDVEASLGGGDADQLEARGALGQAVRRLVGSGGVELVTGFSTRAVRRQGGQVVVSDGERDLRADEVIAVTGLRPDLRVLGELRLDLDDRVEAPRALAPLIDPNHHSCGSVPPHGVEQLSHPEPGVFVVGMKSYGRAPTFLLRTGYEQVRSVVAALAGDWDAARQVHLVLPETGVCSLPAADGAVTAGGCCTPAAPSIERVPEPIAT